jgi:hypothetical protein
MNEQTTTTNGRGGPELFKALAEFQATRPTAKMDGVNPHFKSKYATLESVTDVARGAAEFGLSVTQLVGSDAVTTLLCHSSGEYVSTETRIIASKDSAHGYGSGITYARRYALSAILGIAAGEDDDGNAAVEARRKAKHSQDFKDGKTKFMFPRLKEIGLTMDEVNAYTDHCKRPRLSGLNKADADKLLAGLSASGSDIRNHFDAWRANRG